MARVQWLEPTYRWKQRTDLHTRATCAHTIIILKISIGVVAGCEIFPSVVSAVTMYLFHDVRAVWCSEHYSGSCRRLSQALMTPASSVQAPAGVLKESDACVCVDECRALLMGDGILLDGNNRSLSLKFI